MSSKRKEIREDVAARIRSSVTDVSNRVYTSRAEALGDIELPAICIYSREESVETLDSNPAIQRRTLSLAVEIIVSGSGSIDDDLDELAEDVERELLESSKQAPASGLYHTVELARTEMGFVEGGRKPIGAARLTFEIGYTKSFS